MPSQRQSLACVEDDMKEKLAKSPRLKLALAIAVPVLVMVVTVVMIGASFAWFTDSPDVYIDTISLSTAEAFSLNFTLSEGSENIMYRGQTAITPDGYLITRKWADSNAKTRDDKPYCFVKRVSISSNGKDADINLALDGADIYRTSATEGGPTTTLNSYATQLEKLPYAFTWFFCEAEADTTPKNYTGANVDNGTMIDYEPKSSDVWYTPYGRLEFDDNSVVTSVNGDTTDLTMTKRDILDFNTGAGAKDYDFYIVFAPEEIFFREFFKNLGGKTVDEVYATNTDAVSHMYGSARKGMYYSGYEYMQSTFSFSALLNVVRFDETAGA